MVQLLQLLWWMLPRWPLRARSAQFRTARTPLQRRYLRLPNKGSAAVTKLWRVAAEKI
jgi:hypothetical protein